MKLRLEAVQIDFFLLANIRRYVGDVMSKKRKEERREPRDTFSGIIGRSSFPCLYVRWQRTNSRERAVKVVSNIHEGNISRAGFDGFFRRLSAPVRRHIGRRDHSTRAERVDNFAGKRGKQANNLCLRSPSFVFCGRSAPPPVSRNAPQSAVAPAGLTP